MAWTSRPEVDAAFAAIIVPNGTLDATLASFGLNAAYDIMNVPQPAAFDYLTIGDGYEIRKNTMGVRGHRAGYLYYASIHIWSKQRGTKNVDKMVDRLHQLLDEPDVPLPLATLTHVYTQHQRTTPQTDPTNAVPYLHMVVQYEVYSVQS